MRNLRFACLIAQNEASCLLISKSGHVFARWTHSVVASSNKKMPFGCSIAPARDSSCSENVLRTRCASKPLSSWILLSKPTLISRAWMSSSAKFASGSRFLRTVSGKKYGSEAPCLGVASVIAKWKGRSPEYSYVPSWHLSNSLIRWGTKIYRYFDVIHMDGILGNM